MKCGVSGVQCEHWSGELECEVECEVKWSVKCGVSGVQPEV